MNSTAKKFQYPASLLREFDHWLLLIRPVQITLGSMVLCVKDDIFHHKDLTSKHLKELEQIYEYIETELRAKLHFEKINYLALMMVDPHVHYHIIPRYSKPQKLHHHEFNDVGWPNLPDFSKFVELKNFSELIEFLK